MNPEKAIRSEAKAILSKNNWPAGVGVVITLGVAMMTVIYLSDMLILGIDYLLSILNVDIFDKVSILPLLILLIFTLAGFCFLLPLLMGAVRFMYFMSKTGKADFSETFYYLKRKKYFKSLKTYLGLILRSLWQAALSFIPAAVIYLYATALSTTETTPLLSPPLYLLSYALLCGGILLFNSITTKYFLAVYYYIENDNLSVSDICRLSGRYMKKFGATTIKLNSSLIPVNLACLLVIPALFVLPYVMTTKATSAKWIVELSKQTTPDTTEQTENKDE